MNMTDILENKGQKIDYKKLEEKYNVVAVPIVASKNKGTDKLLETVIAVLNKKKTVKPVSIDYGKEINKEKETLSQLISADLNMVLKYPVNFLAVELIKQESYCNNIINDCIFITNLDEREIIWIISKLLKAH